MANSSSFGSHIQTNHSPSAETGSGISAGYTTPAAGHSGLIIGNEGGVVEGTVYHHYGQLMGPPPPSAAGIIPVSFPIVDAAGQQHYIATATAGSLSDENQHPNFSESYSFPTAYSSAHAAMVTGYNSPAIASPSVPHYTAYNSSNHSTALAPSPHPPHGHTSGQSVTGMYVHGASTPPPPLLPTSGSPPPSHMAKTAPSKSYDVSSGGASSTAVAVQQEKNKKAPDYATARQKNSNFDSSPMNLCDGNRGDITMATSNPVTLMSNPKNVDGFVSEAVGTELLNSPSSDYSGAPFSKKRRAITKSSFAGVCSNSPSKMSSTLSLQSKPCNDDETLQNVVSSVAMDTGNLPASSSGVSATIAASETNSRR